MTVETSSAKRNPLRILVADDHRLVRSFVCSMLTAEGWQVCGEAVNGREAVEMASALRPEVVVLDLSMPEMNGLDAARIILQRMPQITVLLMTMHESEELTHAVLDSGVGACLVKNDLMRLVDEVRALTQSAAHP